MYLCVWNLSNSHAVTSTPHCSLLLICCYVLLVQVAVVTEKVVSLRRHQVGRRSYRVIARVQRRRAALIVKLLQMAVLVLYQGLV